MITRRAAPTFPVVLVLAIVAACGTAQSTATPPASAGLGGSGSPAASSAPAGPLATATSEPAPRAELVLGCISVEDAECQFLARSILAGLPESRGAPFAIEIHLYPCDNPNVPCPKSLSARTGKAIVEFLDRDEPLELSIQGPPLTPAIARQDAFYLGITEPSSPRVPGPGPFAYDVGHCGISHVIDFDGSFWLPVGQVDGDSPTIVNAEAGSMRLLGENLAEFRGESGFTVQLARFPGPKHFWGCD